MRDVVGSAFDPPLCAVVVLFLLRKQCRALNAMKNPMRIGVVGHLQQAAQAFRSADDHLPSDYGLIRVIALRTGKRISGFGKGQLAEDEGLVLHRQPMAVDVAVQPGQRRLCGLNDQRFVLRIGRAALPAQDLNFDAAPESIDRQLAVRFEDKVLVAHLGRG